MAAKPGYVLLCLNFVQSPIGSILRIAQLTTIDKTLASVELLGLESLREMNMVDENSKWPR